MTKYLHTGIVVAGILFLLIILNSIGTTFFHNADAGIQHLLHMFVFAAVALVVAVAILYALLFTPLQKVVLPHADFLLSIEDKLTSKVALKQQLTQAELDFAKAAAINSGLRIIAILLFIGILSTPL